VCGSNGSNSSKAEKILHKRGILVVYDFLANGGGVDASYFEWLRNLCQRYKYEAEIIHKKKFNISVMNPYIMPEFRKRIKDILMKNESAEVTDEWNSILRVIIFAAVNEDYRFAKENGISMKDAGFTNAQFRVLAAACAKMPPERKDVLWHQLPDKTINRLKAFMNHPEVKEIGCSGD